MKFGPIPQSPQSGQRAVAIAMSPFLPGNDASADGVAMTNPTATASEPSIPADAARLMPPPHHTQ